MQKLAEIHAFKTFAFGLLVFLCGSLVWGQERSGSGLGPGKQPEGTSRVSIYSKPDAEAPSDIAFGSEITIVLRATFTANGTVIHVRFWKVEPKDTPKETVKALTKRATEAAKGIEFTPATLEGRPVDMRMQLEYNFGPSKQDQSGAEPTPTDPQKNKDKKPEV